MTYENSYDGMCVARHGMALCAETFSLFFLVSRRRHTQTENDTENAKRGREKLIRHVAMGQVVVTRANGGQHC